MVLQHIEYFRAVAETGNMTKAAAMLHVSQPSLSIAIAKLEDELGVKLFDRVGNRIYLNELGNQFLQKTNRIMRELTDTKDEIMELAGMHAKTVVALSDYDHLFQPILSEFAMANPKLMVTQFLCFPEQIKVFLENGTADFAVTTHDLSSEQITWLPVAKRNRAVLFCEDHPLADRGTVELIDLKNEHFILYSSSIGGEDLTEWIMREFGFEPKIRCITNEFETMVDMLKQNLGIAIITETEASTICSNERVRLFYSVLRADNLMQQIGIATRKDRFQSEAARQFIDYVKQRMEQ